VADTGVPAAPLPVNKGAGTPVSEQLASRSAELDKRRDALLAAQAQQLADLDRERGMVTDVLAKLTAAGLDTVPIDQLRRLLGL